MPLRVSLGTLSMSQGFATTSALELGAATAGAIMMPDAFSGTVLTFQVSLNGIAYRPLTNSAGLVTPAASMAGSRSYPLPSELFGVHSFYLEAGTAQAAARSFIVRLWGPP